MHDHEVSHLTELSRRSLLQTGLLTTASILTGNFLFLENSQAAATVNLAGFSAFKETVKVFKSGNYYLVESNGIPSHNMMVGIKSWQQQIPTPQAYSGSNAWPIPVKPVISKSPISAKDHFLRGAIAVAVNGVPIFNALNNRGDDAFLAGELDDFGGHCGRADDYHYHVAPTHLQSIIGNKLPIAYALDGYPIYGMKEIDGKTPVKLDPYNGHFDAKKNYHYHATNKYPYINGGFKGVVREVDGQVDPQALTKAFRPAGLPLKGAIITSCTQLSKNHYSLTYTLNNAEHVVEYTADLNTVNITFTDPGQPVRTETYSRNGK